MTDPTFWDRVQSAEAFQAAYVSNLPDWVSIWMLVMTITVNLSIPFVLWRVEARWALLVAILTGPLATAGVMILGKAHYPFGLSQVLLWTPLAIYVWWRLLSRLSGRIDLPKKRTPDTFWNRLQNIGCNPVFERVFLVWLSVLAMILTVSLVFDWRNLILKLAA